MIIHLFLVNAMSKSHKKFVQTPGQLSLFACLGKEKKAEPGTLNVDIRLRQAITEGVRRSGKDLIDICTEIYKLTGEEVSIHSMNSWKAESRSKSIESIDISGNKRWGIPAELLPAFCYVVGYWEPLFILAEACNYKALKGKDVVRARMGLLKEEIARNNVELKQLEKALIQDCHS